MSTRFSSFLNCLLFQWNQWQQLAFFWKEFSDFSFTPAPANFTLYTTVSLSLKPFLMDRHSPVLLWAELSVIFGCWNRGLGERPLQAGRFTPHRSWADEHPVCRFVRNPNCPPSTSLQSETLSLHFSPHHSLWIPYRKGSILLLWFSSSFWEWFLLMLKKSYVCMCVCKRKLRKSQREGENSSKIVCLGTGG